jgi:hypothetical protein
MTAAGRRILFMQIHRRVAQQVAVDVPKAKPLGDAASDVRSPAAALPRERDGPHDSWIRQARLLNAAIIAESARASRDGFLSG